MFPLVQAAAFVLALQFFGPTSSAQDSIEGAVKVRSAPQESRTTLFSLNDAPLERTIRMLSPEQMSESDRNLEAEAESSIAELAGFADIAFNQGQWNYLELVCPAFPNHMFLRFSRNSGAGDVSVFSASVPRNGEGRVRIIPIERRSYTLFSPAPINALTVAAFNRIRSEEHPEALDWLSGALCYAALAGANPQIASSTTPILANRRDGGTIIHFTDAASQPAPMEWSLIFDPKGRLVKATHAPAQLPATRNVPASNGKVATRAVPGGP